MSFFPEISWEPILVKGIKGVTLCKYCPCGLSYIQPRDYCRSMVTITTLVSPFIHSPVGDIDKVH